MLYLFCGSDREKGALKKSDFFSVFQKKNPTAELFRLDEANFSEAHLEELIFSEGLFRVKRGVEVNFLISHKEHGSVLKKHINAIIESSTFFFIRDGTLETKHIPIIPDGKGKVFRFDLPKKTQYPALNGFVVSDAFSSKNKKNTWVAYRKALSAGVSAEEIHGAIFWQVKMIFLAKKTKNREEAGMSSFVYGKAKRFESNFSEAELQRIFGRLVRLYHEARTEDGIPLEIALELFLLEEKAVLTNDLQG